MTVGHAPLAVDRLLDVRTTKWQKQLPTTMQYRSDSRRRTSECFCDGLQHGRIRRKEENRKEFNCTQWYSEAEITNDKRLRSTFCIEAIQARSIARPLCDSRASCSLRYGNLTIFKMAEVRHLGFVMTSQYYIVGHIFVVQILFLNFMLIGFVVSEILAI